MSDEAHERDAGNAIGTRGPELAVGLLLRAIGALVVVDALRSGIGWADDGPRAGYFPFYIGLLLMAASAWIIVAQLLRWGDRNPPFAERAQLAGVLAVLLPLAVYVALIKPLGIYVASLLLIGWFMRRHGDQRWWSVAAVAVGVPVVLFLVFERWFLVPLPKGPLEQLLGF
jgi:hypothetical protein